VPKVVFYMGSTSKVFIPDMKLRYTEKVFAKKCCSFVAQCTTFGYPDPPEIREWYSCITDIDLLNLKILRTNQTGNRQCQTNLFDALQAWL